MFTNSFDEKIMNWNKKDFDELVEQMDENEIQDMNWWLRSREIDVDPDCNDYRKDVLHEYIKQWLIQQIDESISSGTAELFEIYRAI
ncbi:MAG: hypothetical protein ACI3WQ_01890 [Faecousia sp.]